MSRLGRTPHAPGSGQVLPAVPTAVSEAPQPPSRSMRVGGLSRNPGRSEPLGEASGCRWRQRRLLRGRCGMCRSRRRPAIASMLQQRRPWLASRRHRRPGCTDWLDGPRLKPDARNGDQPQGDAHAPRQARVRSPDGPEGWAVTVSPPPYGDGFWARATQGRPPKPGRPRRQPQATTASRGRRVSEAAKRSRMRSAIWGGVSPRVCLLWSGEAWSTSTSGMPRRSTGTRTS